FRMIPGLENAEFLRYGSVHRNTFVNAPTLLRDTLQLKSAGRIFLAGQLVGVEGYTEAAATGGLAGINASRGLQGLELVVPPETTSHGALLKYITTSDSRHFQPMKPTTASFRLSPPASATSRSGNAGSDSAPWRTLPHGCSGPVFPDVPPGRAGRVPAHAAQLR